MLALPALPTNDYVARAAVVEGYNSNTYQAQDDANVPIIRRHPSPFTGVDANVEVRFLGRDTDRTTIIVGGRANHYEPLQHENQSDDGSVNAAIASAMTLGPRTTLALRNTGSVTSFNAAHVTDGTILAFDPTQVRSTYWIDDVSLAITHQLSDRWRLTQSFGGLISGTLASAPTLLASGRQVEHRGLDYVMPYAETDLAHELTPRSTGDVMLLYEYAYQLFVYDLTQNPPRNIGPDKQAFLTALAGYTYHFSPDVSAVLRLGGVLGTAPPRDVDQRPILAPAGLLEVYYTRPLFGVVATGGYTWGTINPRLGDGPTANASVLAIGTPRPVGAWKNLALIGMAQVAYSKLITANTQATTLGLYAAGLEARYGVNRWLGLLAGYDLRYATFATGGAFQAPFLEHLVFVGLSGYWSTDREQLPLTTFAAPITPPS